MDTVIGGKDTSIGNVGLDHRLLIHHYKRYRFWENYSFFKKTINKN